MVKSYSKVSTKQYEYLVCIRCHDYLDFVVDTYQAALHFLDLKRTRIVIAVDNNRSFCKALRGVLKNTDISDADIFITSSRRSWGAGLFTLLLESIAHFSSIHSFKHFVSMDYDALLLDTGLETRLDFAATHEAIGLVGCHTFVNPHCKTILRKEKASFTRIFGSFPTKYNIGESIQGGCFCITDLMLKAMYEKGLFQEPYLNAYQHTKMTDDYLVPYIARICELNISDAINFMQCTWKAKEDPRSLRPVIVYHPMKFASRAYDVEVRNHFRSRRYETSLLKV